MSSHNREKFKKEFCAVAADGACDCGNDYKKNCVPAPAWDSANDFTWFIKGQGARQQSYAPHHILCVASVATILIDATDKQVDGIVEATKWCVNKKPNMIALPLWGHTVKWYCNISALSMTGGQTSPPPFQNLPQHDWDHTGKGAYIEELEEVLKNLVKQLAKKGHEAKPIDLAGAMDKLAAAFEAKLKARGLRQGGTHTAWQNGATNKDWFLPFSMANDGSATRKGYPKMDFSKKVLRKLQWLANQIK